MRSASVQIEDVDLYELAMNRKRVEWFERMVKVLQMESTLSEDSMQGFKVQARRVPFSGAGELKAASGRKVAFREAWQQYSNPYKFLMSLGSMDAIPESEYYKYFVRIEYNVINRDGFPVSGGERSEFRLLQEISDAQKHSLLLLDEPESSFDNTFLNSDVNSLIRDISKTMPVIVVTHNSTVGASIGADYLLYARKDTSGPQAIHKIYYGYPTDRTLNCGDGTILSNHKIMMDSLEAGKDAYDSRRKGYEAIED